MAVYIIAYDLTRASYEEYTELHQKIHETGYASARIQLSTFLVASDQSAFAIRDQLRSSIGYGEKLIVAEVGNQVAGLHEFSKEIKEWLNTYLAQSNF